MSDQKVMTLGQLYKQDVNQAYLLFVHPSSYGTHSRFLNKDKYQLYDYPPSFQCNELIYPRCHSCVAGDEIPVLTDYPPPEVLKEHWKTWLPVFSPAKFISVDEGLKDDGIPILTTGAFEGIPKSKHSVDPDVLERIQSKSCIPEIGVPCPRYMDEQNVQYPCVVKVDLSDGSNGVFKANNREEMLSIVKEIREKRGWKGGIVYQEFIQGQKEVISSLFYLKKNADVVWLGTGINTFENEFEWTSLIFDWNEQDQQKNIVYDDFVIPISQYLHRNGYFGVMDVEIVINELGRYLVDVNVRLAGETAHHLIAPYMASMGFTFSYFHFIHSKDVHKGTTQELVEAANRLNHTQQEGRIIVCGMDDCQDENYHCALTIFSKSREDCQALLEKLKE